MMTRKDWQGKKVLVMGLGLHGGGAAAARWLAEAGARVTVTDLRKEEVLRPSMDSLQGLPISYILGEHRRRDFLDTDFVIKNPDVPARSPWLEGIKNVETDISLFLRMSSNPLLAVTGSKGKSTVVTALHHILKESHPQAYLGGNIKRSPLNFLNQIVPQAPVVLELSSWQLGDLRDKGILHPRAACITNLLWDHQNRYDSWEDYESDKKEIFKGQQKGDAVFFPQDAYGQQWQKEAPGEVFFLRSTPPGGEDFRGVWLDEEGSGWMNLGKGAELLFSKELKVPGEVFKKNLLFAGGMAGKFGVSPRIIRAALEKFPGIPYRLELFLEKKGIRFYDDTTATIPDAAAAGVKAMDAPVILLAGGKDKSLDFQPFDEAAALPKRIIMLEGSATEKWLPRLKKQGAPVEGPYASMEQAVERAWKTAREGDCVLLSPGTASFGMFRHEFHRGDAFKAACRRLE